MRGGQSGTRSRGGPAGIDFDPNVGQTLALTATENVGIGIDSASADTKLHVRKTDAVNNATTDVLTLEHSLTSGNGAAGMGTGIAFWAVDAAGNRQIVAKARAALTTATNGSEVG